MKFDKLHEMIPYVMGGKQKSLTMTPYNAITLAMPGRHAKDTTPVGGDFVVCVTDENTNWLMHQFTHTDLFRDLEAKATAFPHTAENLMEDYLKVITGADPEKFDWHSADFPGVHPQTFLYAVQALAVAEHRRYAHFESKFGGRFLPFRFATGIVERLWTANMAADKQKYGRPAVERLEKEFGTPWLTKELMS